MSKLARVKADFPILNVPGRELVYLDSAATSQKPRSVLDAMQNYYETVNSNVHRGVYGIAAEATDQFEQTRRKVARFIGANSQREVIYTKNASEAINLVAYSWARKNLQAGDAIVLTQMEHHSNIVPWHFHRERKGAELKWVDVADDGSFDVDAFEQALSPRTKIVAITHMSNVLGTVTPLKQIIEIAHAKSIPVLVDGSQGAVHTKVDVQDLGADFYIMTGHKLYGPTGIGVLYGRSDLLAEMRPYQGGGEMIEDVTLEDVTYNNPPHRFEAGTPPIVQAIGLGAALDYINAIGRGEIEAHEKDVGAYAAAELQKINGLRMIGTARDKGAIFSFEIEGVHAHDLSAIMDRYGVAIRAGTHCAQPLLKRFGATSTCRASFALYNGKDDVDALVDAIKRASAFFA